MGLFLLFLILTGLSIAALVVGFVAFMAMRGKTTTRRGRDAGAAVMGALDQQPPESGQATLVSASREVFVGTGVEVKVEAESSFAELKSALRERRWRDALPSLLIFGGLLGFLLFGALALWAGTGYQLWGLAIVALAAYIAARQLRDLARA
jgi:hypothetical protein